MSHNLTSSRSWFYFECGVLGRDAWIFTVMHLPCSMIFFNFVFVFYGIRICKSCKVEYHIYIFVVFSHYLRYLQGSLCASTPYLIFYPEFPDFYSRVTHPFWFQDDVCHAFFYFSANFRRDMSMCCFESGEDGGNR